MKNSLWRRFFLALCAGVLGIGVFMYFKSAPPGQSAMGMPPVAITAAQAMTQDVPLEIQAVGTVTPFQSVAIKSRIESQIVAVNFHDGDKVNKDDLLFVLDDRAISAQLEKARAELVRDKARLEDLKIQYQRNDSLLEGKAISKQVVESSKFAVDAQAAVVTADAAAVEDLKTQLSYTRITAPIEGRTGTITSTVGNNVKINDVPLVTINQIQPILVQSSLPQNNFDEVRGAMSAGKVAVTARIGDSTTVADGTLEYIDNTIDKGTGTFVARASFANSNESLWPGMLVSVTLIVGGEKNAVVIPEVAVQNSFSGDFVFIIDGEKAQKRKVKVKRNFNGLAIISDGVKVGETVATDGMLSLADGAAVSIRAQEVKGAP